jgi:hypothetical protein
VGLRFLPEPKLKSCVKFSRCMRADEQHFPLKKIDKELIYLCIRNYFIQKEKTETEFIEKMEVGRIIDSVFMTL